jgi:general secretion pathway protein L
VYFNYRVVARRPQNQQLDVQLSVVPRAVVEGVIDWVIDWKLVQAKADDQVDRDERIFAFEPGSAEPRSSSALQRGLLVANLVLLITVIVIPFVQQNHYLEQLRARLSEVRAAATTASNLQQRIDQHLERSRYLFAQKAGQPASVALLEELSRRIPDETWLFRAEVRDGRVHLQGTSTRASALIAELEGSRFLEDVHFASPVTQDGASGRERFHLSASIVAQAPPALTEGREGRDS